MPKRPMLTMTVAVLLLEETGRMKEAPLGLLIKYVDGDAYLALRTGASSVLLNEYEARALSVAMERLSDQATSLNSARDRAERDEEEA